MQATRGGDVILSVTISQAGVPEEIEVAKSHGKEFDEQAIVAFRQCRFKPAIFKNEPSAVRGMATLHLTCPTYRGLMAVPAVSDYSPRGGERSETVEGFS
jgi:TonB family protein